MVVARLQSEDKGREQSAFRDEEMTLEIKHENRNVDSNRDAELTVWCCWMSRISTDKQQQQYLFIALVTEILCLCLLNVSAGSDRPTGLALYINICLY